MPEQDRFQPAPDFTYEINRAERTQQARLLVPLLADPRGRAWFLEGLQIPCTLLAKNPGLLHSPLTRSLRAAALGGEAPPRVLAVAIPTVRRGSLPFERLRAGCRYRSSR